MLKADKEKLEIREIRVRENSVVVYRCKNEDDFNHKLKILEGNQMSVTGFNRARREALKKKGGSKSWHSGLKMVDLRNIANQENVEVPAGVKSKKELIQLIEANR